MVSERWGGGGRIRDCPFVRKASDGKREGGEGKYEISLLQVRLKMVKERRGGG